jgi:hypothetical protein
MLTATNRLQNQEKMNQLNVRISQFEERLASDVKQVTSAQVSLEDRLKRLEALLEGIAAKLSENDNS